MAPSTAGAPEARPSPQPIGGVMLDVDGVLKDEGDPIPGAIANVSLLRALGVPLVLASNTTSITSAELAARLQAMGFEISPTEVVTPASLAARWIREHCPGARTLFVGEGDPFGPEDGLAPAVDDVHVVIVGGNGPSVTFARVNAALRALDRGARLVALHRSLTWRTFGGRAMDAGMIVTALEQATGVRAIVIGKPSPRFFHEALAVKDLLPQRTLMIGDDLDNDVLAAQRLGMTGVLVRTGKFRPETLNRAGVPPHYVIDSIAALPQLVARLGIEASDSVCAR